MFQVQAHYHLQAMKRTNSAMNSDDYLFTNIQC
jgi:hypothetical protein